MISEKKIVSSFSLNKSMKATDPQAVASFDSRGLMGRIYEGTTNHYYIL